MIRLLRRPRHTLVTVADTRPWLAETVGATARSPRSKRVASSRLLTYGTVSDTRPWLLKT
jgi:hypothetical protein